MLFRSEPGRPVPGAALLGLAFVTRINQGPGLFWLFGLRCWQAARRSERRFVLAAATLATISLMPALHDIYYGGQLEFLTRSAVIPQNLVLRPAHYWQALNDQDLREKIDRQIDWIVYGSSANDAVGGGLLGIIRGLQAVWLGTLLALLFRPTNRRGNLWRTTLRFLRSPDDVRDLCIVLTPIWFLAAHLFYQVDVYYPRHIVMGYVAMATTALYVTGQRSLPKHPS